MNDIAIQPNGKIVAVGEHYWSDWISGMYSIMMVHARFHADGSPDPTWAGAPFMYWGEESASAVAIAPHGEIVIAGSSLNAPPWKTQFLLGRRDGESGPLDVTTITGGPTGQTSDTTPEFTFTAAEPGSTVECKLDGPGATAGSFTPCTSPKAYSALADGDYTFTVRATDPAGIPPGPVRSFTVETIPNTTITSGPGGPTNETVASFWFTASTAGATFECKLDRPSGLAATRRAASPAVQLARRRRVHVLGSRDQSARRRTRRRP